MWPQALGYSICFFALKLRSRELCRSEMLPAYPARGVRLVGLGRANERVRPTFFAMTSLRQSTGLVRFDETTSPVRYHPISMSWLGWRRAVLKC